MIIYVTRENIKENFTNLGANVLIIPVLSQLSTHYVHNRISSIYLYCMDSGHEYVVGIHANDLDNIPIEIFYDNLPDRKYYSYNGKILQIDTIDIELLVWFYTGKTLFFTNDDTMIFNKYNSMHPEYGNIGDVMPIMRVLEYWALIRKWFTSNYNGETGDGFNFYNEVYHKSMIQIERNGIHVDRELFNGRFNKKVKQDIFYSEYNLCTLTGRPSNTFGGVNISALNKSDGSRKLITSRFSGGKLVEYDYDSYHIRLIAKLIGYTLPEGNLHKYFAKLYFNTDDITDELYNKSKAITFKQIYGSVDDQYSDIEFYIKIQEYIDRMWDNCQKDGYFKSPLVGRKFKYEWYDNMTPTKMFNYIIQSYETELNSMIIIQILQYLYKKKSKLIMYTYDAFIIDYCPDDGHETLHDIHKIVKSLGYPARISAGVNYHDMFDVTLSR